MSFQQNQLTKTVNQAQDIFDEYIYRPTNGDTLDEVTSDGYFSQSRYANDLGWFGSLLTFYINGVLYNSRIDVDRVTLLSGASSFAIGPTPNEFRAATRAACIISLEAQTFAKPEWTAIYDAAPLGSTGTLNVKIFYAVDDVQYMELLGRDNGAWAVNQSFEGIVGPQGVSGNGVKSSFNSVAEMNTFYTTDNRYENLQTGDNNSVTINGAVFQFEWAGSDSPGSYDPDLFRLAEIGTTAGSLIMGPTSIESGSEVLMFKSATGGQHYIVQSFFDQSGSSVPQYYDAGPIADFDLALVADTSLDLPIDFETIFPETNIFTTYTIKPSLEGSFQFQTFLGTRTTHDEFPILSENIEILSGDVGNDLTVNMKNPAVINAGQKLYTKLSGEAKLFGGMQTEGPEAGQTTMYAKLGMQTVTKFDLALVADLSDSVINPGLGKVKAAGNLGLLSDQLKEGTNITLSVTDNDITITATGGSLDGAVATVLDGNINIDYDDVAETDSQLIQADKAGTVLTRPEYTTSTAAAGRVDAAPIGSANEIPGNTETFFTVTETTVIDILYFTAVARSSGYGVLVYILDSSGATLRRISTTMSVAEQQQEFPMPVPGGITLNPGVFSFQTQIPTLGETTPQFAYNSTGVDVTLEVALTSDLGIDSGGGGGGGGGLSGADVTVDADADVLDVKYDITDTESQIIQSITNTDGSQDRPYYESLGTAETVDISLTATKYIPDGANVDFVFAKDAVIASFNFKPENAGEYTVLCRGLTATLLKSEKFDVAQSDVGTTMTVSLPTTGQKAWILNNGESYNIRFFQGVTGSLSDYPYLQLTTSSGSIKQEIALLSDGGEFAVKASVDDDFPGYLDHKITAGANIEVHVVDEGMATESIEIVGTGGGGIGDIEMTDIAQQAIGFTIPAGNEYIIPQVEFFPGDSTTGTPFYYSLDGGATVEFNSVERGILGEVVIGDGYKREKFEGYTGIPLQSITIRTSNRNPGEEYYLTIRYKNDAGENVFVDTDNIIVGATEEDVIVPFKSTVNPQWEAGDTYTDIYVTCTMISGTAGGAILMGSSSGFSTDFWFNLEGEEGVTQKNLAVESALIPLATAETQGLTIVPFLNVETIISYTTTSAGTYKFSGSCIMVTGGATVRWAQITLYINGTLITQGQTTVTAADDGSNYFGDVMFDRQNTVLASGDLIEMKVESSSYTDIGYKSLSCYVFKIANA